ncbi:sensor histidine kinase [Flavobacterium faecale]|uniref:sensor histidine kinase n=1 Tax=Flavobacterium faecale TaxID=1355330 RepID=UPI003AB03324
MSKLEEILKLVRSINADEFQSQLTVGDSLDDVYEELLFLAKKIEAKKKRITVIIEHISNCFAGNFFDFLPISEEQDELDVFCMGFNTYIEELKAVLVSKNVLESSNQKLVKEREHSEKLALEKEIVLSNIRHEIRTPLNGILGFADLLLSNHSLDAESKNQLEYIKLSAAILKFIVNDVIDLAKINSAEITLSVRPFSLVKLTQMIQDTFLVKIRKKDVKFIISIDKNVPDILSGDAVLVSQVLLNLVNSAVELTQEKGELQINIELAEDDRQKCKIKIELQHSGKGISIAQTAGVFNPFVAINDDSSRRQEGIGEGFAISKKIVDALNGEIKIVNKIDVPSSISLILPFAK